MCFDRHKVEFHLHYFLIENSISLADTVAFTFEFGTAKTCLQLRNLLSSPIPIARELMCSMFEFTSQSCNEVVRCIRWTAITCMPNGLEGVEYSIRIGERELQCR